ncbi:MAG: glycosyltransferase family 2 protein [Syntrophales bacterium]
MIETAKAIFWVSIVFILYTYIGYPLLIRIFSIFVIRRVDKQYVYPGISIVIAALNEGDRIGKRIENLLGQEYPQDRMEIIIISDGSTDGTEHVVRKLLSRSGNIRLHSFSKRRGKAACINQGIRMSSSDIIILTDARQTFHRRAVKELVANFHDPAVGAVSGELFLKGSRDAVGRSFASYWDLEKWVRKSESKIHSVIGLTGAVCAIRKKLFEPLPECAILDDVIIPMRILLKGHRIIFDEKAVAYDEAPLEPARELSRKIRTLTGNFQILKLMPMILSPRHNPFFFQYFSHKITRLMAPLFTGMMFLSNLFLTDGIYLGLLVGQVLFYVTALTGIVHTSRQSRNSYLFVPAAFLLLNFAVIKGFLNTVQGREDVWVENH